MICNSKFSNINQICVGTSIFTENGEFKQLEKKHCPFIKTESHLRKQAMKSAKYISTGLLLAASVAHAAQVALPLNTIDATGTLYSTGFNTETEEPNTPAGKDFNYPYYFDSAQNLWVIIVAEPLRSDYVYTYEEANFGTIFNQTITDPNAGTFNFGELSWDDSLITGVGSETIGVGNFTFSLNPDRFSPNLSANNLNNEANWAYNFLTSNLLGTGLSFTDGELTSIDFTADLSIQTLAFGSFPLADTFDGNITFSGLNFAFNVDQIKDINTPLGPANDVHTVFDVAGSVVVPEPQTYGMIFGLLVICLAVVRKRKK